jgi:hypothetical protein
MIFVFYRRWSPSRSSGSRECAFTHRRYDPAPAAVASARSALTNSDGFRKEQSDKHGLSCYTVASQVIDCLFVDTIFRKYLPPHRELIIILVHSTILLNLQGFFLLPFEYLRFSGFAISFGYLTFVNVFN